MSASLLQDAESAPAAMDVASTWQRLFFDWPQGVPRRGVIVTCLGEQIPFNGFMTSPTLLMLERRNPDTEGARKVIVPFGNIAAVKIIDVIQEKHLRAAGFDGKLDT